MRELQVSQVTCGLCRKKNCGFIRNEEFVMKKVVDKKKEEDEQVDYLKRYIDMFNRDLGINEEVDEL